MSNLPVDPRLLGALSRQHELLAQVVENLPEAEVNRRFHPDLPSLGWLLGRAVYLELYWLREHLHGDADLSARVRHLFGHQACSDTVDAQLPPKDHLLNWALEIFDQDLTALANLPAGTDHPLARESWLPNWLLQSLGLVSEQMMVSLLARSLSRRDDYRVSQPLRGCAPRSDSATVLQGHYRIGAHDGVVRDNERPAQVVELSGFRIARQPVSNAEFLGFIDAGGYQESSFWDEAGLVWLKRQADPSPWQWRRDAKGHWYGIGLNGPADLPPDDPVSGLCQHEAVAFARWADMHGGALAGAIVQHEYQWEVAARTGAIGGFGRAWEWCSQPLHPYDQYQPPGDPELASQFDGQLFALRGGCLHTQPALRRASLREGAPPDRQAGCHGTRLVLPPEN